MTAEIHCTQALGRTGGDRHSTLSYTYIIENVFLKSMLEDREAVILTRRPETSEYFLAGLKDGGASILKSGEKKRKVQN